MKSYAVLTSGGDSPGMNAAIRAVVKVAAAAGVQVLGVERGYDGLMDGAFRPLTRELTGTLAPIDEIELIGRLGGTVLGSVRSPEFRTEKGREQALRELADMDGLIVIGGNGSLAGAHALAREGGIPVIGVPASIDNDIGCTSTAIGVDTALNTIIEACDHISDTARAHRRAFIVEVMGRQCGYLAMAAAVATAADAVLFRERDHAPDLILDKLEAVMRRAFDAARAKRRVLILKAEGVEFPTIELTTQLQKRVADLGTDVRATILGHVVRGGNPSYRDRMVAGRLGFAAVNALAEGATDEMVAWSPPLPDGIDTADPYVKRFSLDRVLSETTALLDGTSPVTQRRVAMMESIEGVLAI